MGHPGRQPAFVGLEEAGLIRGSVLDAGCGTGENALYLASRGHEVWGLDFIPVAIEGAKAKERGLGVDFQVGDALKLDQLGRTFDTVIDCGLFHTFADEERPLYVSGLLMVLRTVWEDQTLREELAGYEEYTQRVRYRLIPGVW